MSEQHLARRLQFAKTNKSRNWKRVLFCDETSIQLQQCVNSKNNVQYETSRENVKPIDTFKHPLKVHIAAGISWYGKTSLYIFTENLTADMYIKILNQTILPDAKNIFGDTKWTLLQDNDPKHTSRKVQDYLHNQNIDMIDPKNDQQILQISIR